jgi:predicted CoA-binding protein
MVNLPEPVAEFLRGKRIAVAGVSREPAQPANAVYRKLRRNAIPRRRP